MTIHSERQIDRNEPNEPKLNSPGNVNVDLTREQVPGRHIFSSASENNKHLDLSGDIYGSSKYELLAYGPGKTSPAPPPGTIVERAPEPGKFADPITYREPLSRVFGHSYSELGRHHNQILDVDLPDLLKKQGIGLNEPLILCNFDTHSDMHKPPMPSVEGDNESIGNWVNRMIANNKQITDFYWVMPDELRNNEHYRDHFFSGGGKDGNLADDPRNQTIFVNNETQEINWKKPEDYSATKYREVGIHKRTLDEMPDMKDKHIIWTTDLDGFDNRGFDTSATAKIPWQGEKGFEKYVKTMDDKHIRPFFHFISQSTEYTTMSHTNELNRFAVEAGAASLNGGDINIANYRNIEGQDHVSHDLKHRGYNGITVGRQQNPEYELLYKLFATDARTTSPDGKIVLNKPNAECNAAIDEVIKVYSGHEELAKELTRKFRESGEAIPMKEGSDPRIKGSDPRIRGIKILRYLDSKDGKKDGIVNFRVIENNIIVKAVRNKTQ